MPIRRGIFLSEEKEYLQKQLAFQRPYQVFRIFRILKRKKAMDRLEPVQYLENPWARKGL
jgi:hypothetical protein